MYIYFFNENLKLGKPVNLVLISSIISTNRSRLKPILFDQGLFQALWSCYFYNQEPLNSKISSSLTGLVNQLMDHLTLTNVIVFEVSSDKATILSRLATRKIKGSSPINSLEESLINLGIDATISTRNLVLDLARNSNRVIVYEIKN